MTIKVIVAYPLSTLDSCNLELTLDEDKEGGTICMQSVAVSEQNYSMQVKMFSESGELAG